MADRFPLILNTSANQIQEIASGDQLDLSGNNIANAGVITATTFSGSIAGASNGILGIITAAAADIDDFIEVGSNIQLGNAGVVTATTFKGNGDFVELDVDGHTNLDNVSIAGVVTATVAGGNNQLKIETTSSGDPSIYFAASGSGGHNIEYIRSSNTLNFKQAGGSVRMSIAADGTVDVARNLNANLGLDVTGNTTVSGDIDVDGHTNLDNVSIVGLATVSRTSGDGADPIFKVLHSNLSQGILFGYNTIAATGTNTNVDLRLESKGSGLVYVIDALQAQAGLNVTGNATVSGNLSVGGVLTYEDVTNVDSVGIVTARTGLKVLAGGANVVGVVTATGGVFVPDNNQIQLGNAAGSADLKIYHDTSDSIIHQDGTGDLRIRSDNNIEFNTNGTQNAIWCDSGAAVKLYYNNGLKLATTDTGIDVTGQVVADSASFTDDGSSSPTVKIFTDDANPYALNIGNSSYNASSPFGLNFFNNNSGEGYFRHIGNGSYKDYHFSLHDNSNNKLCIKFEGDDQSVELYGRGTKDLETTGTGVVVSGVCTATSFSGDGSGLSNVGISTEQVTPSSNVATLNLAKDDHKIVASGTYTIDVSGGTEAESHTLRIENSGTANVGFSTYFKFPSGGTPSLPTASGAISLISFSVHKVGSVGIATVLLSGASVNYS